MKSLKNLLLEKRVLVCAGTGGVGKTSLSAALGVWAAKLGKNVLVLTIDPARRLQTAVGLEGVEAGAESVRVGLPPEYEGSLYIAKVDAKILFDQFVKRESPDPLSAEKLLNNLLYKKLSMGLEGSQEFTSLECFLSHYEKEAYDLIILDTPPSQHAIDFLEAPKKLAKLFDEKILKWFVSENEGSQSFLQKIIQKGTRKAFSVLEKLTGEQFVDEIFSFFVSMKAIRRALVVRTKKVDEILHGEEVGFLLISAYDARKIHQAFEFFQKLKSLGYHPSALVVNRCFIQLSEREREVLNSEMKDYYQKLWDYHKKEEETYAGILADMRKDLAVLRVSELLGNLGPLEVILQLSESLQGAVSE